MQFLLWHQMNACRLNIRLILAFAAGVASNIAYSMTSFHLWPSFFQLHSIFKWDNWFKTHLQHANPQYGTVTLGF